MSSQSDNPKDPSGPPQDLNQESLKKYIDSMQDIFSNLCTIMGDTEKDKDIDTKKVSGVFDDISKSLESIVGKDDAMYKNLKKDIRKMKKEMKKASSSGSDSEEGEKKKKKKKKKKKETCDPDDHQDGNQ